MQTNDYFICRGGQLKPSQKPIKVAEKDTITNRQKKLQYYVDDPNNVINEFEKYVRSKYGFTRGIIGKEVIAAFENHLTINHFGVYKNRSIDLFNFEGPAHKQLKTNHEILLKLLEKNYKESEVVKFKDIQDIIRREFNRTDRRTHKSYVDALRSRELLIQPDGVPDYDYYFFKELPAPREGRPSFVVDVQTKLIFPGNKIYSLLPEDGSSITIGQIRRMTTLKEADIMTGINQLENLGLLKTVRIGTFKKISMEGSFD